MTYQPCHATDPAIPYNTTESVRAACGTCGGDRRLPIEASRRARAQERSRLLAESKAKNAAARAGRIADKEGVIGA